MKSITALCHAIATDKRGDAIRIAAGMGKPYGTLMREISPTDLRAKLGVDDLALFCRAAADIAPLRLLADMLDHDVVPRVSLNGPVDALDAYTALERVAELSAVTGRLASTVLQHVADGEYAPDELEELDRLLAEAQGTLAVQRREVELAVRGAGA